MLRSVSFPAESAIGAVMGAAISVYMANFSFMANITWNNWSRPVEFIAIVAIFGANLHFLCRSVLLLDKFTIFVSASLFLAILIFINVFVSEITAADDGLLLVRLSPLGAVLTCAFLAWAVVITLSAWVERQLR